MPSQGAAVPKPRISRAKKAQKTGLPAQFFVAPTTPFIPARKRLPSFALKASPSAPSPHLVDLRTTTAARPHVNVRPAATEKKERRGFASFDVPRTLSERPGARRVWDQFALVAFGRFVFAVAKALVMAAGQLVIFPLILGLKIVDRFDTDRPQSLEGEITNNNDQITKKIEIPNPEIDKNAEPVVPIKEKSKDRNHFKLRRALVSFAGASLAVILPIQGFSAYRTIETIRERARAAQTVSLGALNGTSSFADAQAAILQTRQAVTDLGNVANALLERAPHYGGMFRSGKDLLNAGSSLAAAASLLTRSMDSVNDPSLTVTDKLGRAQALAEQAEPLLASAKTSLEEADALPEGVSENVASLKEKVNALENLVSSFISVAPGLRDVLGEKQARRYMVIFQNNAELRPTGGFIGSFAIVDVDRGAIKKVEVPAGGSYDLQGSLKANVLSPEPLRLVRAKWEFQDANWFPDFAESAKKLTWFYAKSNGPSVDGVISVNAPVLAALLDAVGPINMPAYKTVATSTTVLSTAQQIVESPEARESGKPKQFIADLMPLVLERVMSSDGETAVKTASVFAKALEQKDIQMYFTDASDQQAFDRLGWTGRFLSLPEGFDSFALVRANIAGAKTDAVVKTDVRHESAIASDGSVTDRVTITLAHEGRKGEPFTGVRNVSYLRIYVPQGSKLIKAGGDIRPPASSFFDIPEEGCAPDLTVAELTGPVLHDPNTGTAINDEFGRTVFGVWTQTDPGHSSTVTFEYSLPFRVAPQSPASSFGEKLGLAAATPAQAAFGLVIEKQSGAANTEINSSLKLPEGWYPSFASPEGIARNDGWSYTTNLDENKVVGAMVTN